MTSEYTDEHRPDIRPTLATTLVAALGIAAVWLVVWVELGRARSEANWGVLIAVATLLLVCERIPATWINFGPVGVVTPRWMFAFALLLLGSPLLAVSVAVVGAAIHAVARAEPPATTVVRIAGTGISVASASFVLEIFEVDGAITGFARIPVRWAVGIVAAGVTIVLLNAIIGAVGMSLRRRIPFVVLLRRGFTGRISAEGALLSLVPIWVIGIDASPVLLPLLVITSLLVFRSTRQALQQAHEAYHDGLTGLPNRRAFLAQVDDALETSRTHERPVVMIMDLNGFKDINDRLGHQIGDALLAAFGERLEASRPAGAYAARLGGDEFGVVVVTDPESDAVRALVGALHDKLAKPLNVEGFPMTLGVSIGVARTGADGTTTRQLLRSADVAMYTAKRSETNVELYDPEVRAPQTAQLDLLADLSEALDHHQIQISYQPLLRIADGEVDGAEALVRWHHPELGLIPPSDFVGLAEQTDLIGPLTEMVLRDATEGLRGSEVKLAVNVSARSLQDKYFAGQVFAVLGQTAFPSDALELEITERAIVSNPDRSRYTIERLREAGVRITIDDFGVGYSSYQTLRSLQVDRVKIDREFVAGLLSHPRDRKIVASLIDLAHDLGAEVVAEGVESPQMWDALADLGCDIAQGYGIAVPMPHAAFRTWLHQWHAVVDSPLESV